MKINCTTIAGFAFDFFVNSLKTVRRSRCTRQALAVACITSLVASVNVSAQTSPASSATSPPSIEFSADEKTKLSGIFQFREHLKTLVEAGKKPSFRITMLDDQGKLRESSVSPEFEAQLLNDDISGVVESMQKWKLEFKYPIRGQKIYIGVEEDTTPEYLLFRAAAVNHLELASMLLKDHDMNINTRHGQESKKITALTAATSGQYGEMVELLLNAGADPNIKSEGGRAPLGLAVQNGDITSTRALFQAGATLEAGFNPRGVRIGIFFGLVDDNEFEIAQLLLKNGAILNSRRLDPGSLTPLLLALIRGQSEMTLALLPYSDPRLYTVRPIERAFLGIEDIKLLPRANALFFAQLREAELDPAIEQLIEERTEILGGQDAILLSRLQAAASTSDFAYYQGNLEEARAILEKALNGVSVERVKNASDSNFASIFKELLAKQYELSIILDEPLSDDSQILVSELAVLGTPVDHWHAMLETIEAAKSGDYEPRLLEWQQQFAGRDTREWGYSRLNEWIGSMASESDRKRLYRAVDFFEFSVSSSK